MKKHSIKSSNEAIVKSTTEEKTSLMSICESQLCELTITICDNEIKQKKKIRKLERKLSRLSKVIRELEGKELSLDEMRYSDLYVVEANLKKQAYEVI